jgi:DNA polymerase elongation subunit (family B)
MSYVDAIFDRNKDEIHVVERIQGERIYNTMKAEHVFYYEHPSGGFKTIFGEPCKKYSTNDGRKFKRELMKIATPYTGKPRKIFESDINPIFRSLADHYTGADTPTLNIAYFDIETDFDPERGFAPTDDPFNPITAISVHCGWLNKLFTLVLVPPTYTWEQGLEIAGRFENTVLFDDERDLLRAFMDVIEDSDILTGWNSEGYDIPYTVNRIIRILGKEYTKALCLFDQYPREREYEKFKRTQKTYDLVGRVHLDYLLLYQKHNTQQLHSYRLDYVGEIEVGENKIPYEGTLDDLYKKDFQKFIEYNRQDTLLLYKIDSKKKFIELANQIAHANCVLLKTTMGSVALVEQAIINEMHAMGFIVPDRKRTQGMRDGTWVEPHRGPVDDDEDDEGRTPVVGAYVAKPKVGLRSHVGCCDINSLYPSALRALNMSPETIFGQFRPTETMELVAKRIAEGTPRAEAWEGLFHSLEYGHVFEQSGAPLTVDFEDGTTRTMSGRQWYEYIFNPKNHLCVTANGTLFRTDKDGTIPMLLAKWYADRKTMQGKEKDFLKLAEAETDPTKKAEYKALQGFWNQRQQARKILLNSLYGALLNEGLRFYDERVGQSVTLTGRSIVRHMNAKINEVITGEYDYRGEGIVYADTDSCYFSAYEVLANDPAYAEFEWTKENIIELYDSIADVTNESFPAFMHNTFNTSLERGGIIKAGRELVGSKCLFIKKKKYAILVYDLENNRMDVNGKPGKLKAMGLDLKRADTPKPMQKFLESILMDLLTDVPREDMYRKVREFRKEFVKQNGWEKGSPKKVSALSDYRDKAARADENAKDFSSKKTLAQAKGTKNKVQMPGHVLASINWNDLCKLNKDRYSMRIGDGSKIVVCKLRPNIYKMDSIAFPIDEPHLPAWFKELPFDHKAMEEIIIDAKLTNLVGVLDWDLNATKEVMAEDIFVF